MNHELSYQEDKIKQMLSEMNSTFSDIRFKMEINAEYHEYNDLEETFIKLFKDVFNLCLVYFEAKGLLLHRSNFESELLPLFEKREDLLKGDDKQEPGEFYSTLIPKLWGYLLPFPAFESSTLFFRRSGILFLENILQNTSVILTSLKAPDPTCETDVSNKVKVVCKAIFTTTQLLPKTESFLKSATYYKPDIIIPEINCAIEYKFISIDQTQLNNHIDQILMDVQGYKHTTIRWFYAVFYVKPGICTKERFNLIWEEKNFPRNWRPIFVEGQTGIKKSRSRGQTQNLKTKK